MLRGLSIRDMLLIGRLELEFQPGLNVLTGETGAGKSILLDSLGFVLGWRGQSDLVRKGADQAEVTAEFDLSPDHPAMYLLDEAGLPGRAELILRRVSKPDGRKQAYVNDRRCSAETLRRITETLVELHGQQDDGGLLNMRGHRALLDAFAGVEALLLEVRTCWKELSRRQDELSAARDEVAAAEKDREYLLHAVEELDALAPEPGEDAALDAKRRLMQAAERIREDIVKAAGALGHEGAEGAFGDAARWLQGVESQAEGRLDAPLEALARAAEELDSAQRGVADCLAALEFNPHELENAEERLFAIRSLARKHGVAADDLGAFGDQLRQKLAAVEGGASRIATCEEAVVRAEKIYREKAASLSGQRREAALKLDLAMAGELAPLKMERAVFKTEITDLNPGSDGIDGVQFTVATNPGAPAGPLNKIASGGELSRFLLALKVCLSGQSGDQTMIFDEIDRGIGGATADAVGRRLAALAETGQVLVVTHSPQVAAFGAHHWRVEKRVKAGATTSEVVPIAGGTRVDEIARMLAGDVVTDEARAAAGILLKSG